MFLQNDAYATIRSSMSLEKHLEWAPAIHPIAPNPASHQSLPSQAPAQLQCMQELLLSLYLCTDRWMGNFSFYLTRVNKKLGL